MKPPNTHAFGAAVDERCVLLRLTGAEIARRAHISHPYLTRIRQGRCLPTFAVAARIAAALGVSLQSLRYDDEPADAA